MLHRLVPNFQNLGLFHRDDVCGARLAGEERHLSEKVPFAQYRNGPRAGSVGDLDSDPTAVDYKHRRSFLAGAN